jgi:hypothetical protein
MLDDGVGLTLQTSGQRGAGRSSRQVSVLTWASGGCAGAEPRGALGRVGCGSGGGASGVGSRGGAAYRVAAQVG